ncbi:MAG: AAA family ATPase [Proteobacteria bacterium]|nr:AAA family ATPase [Pseudomonadota bacterium]NIS67484.1 AAA family ATPase [Pseudomonadota bacterium]
MPEVKTFEEVPPGKLRWQCDLKSLPFKTTQEVSACEVVIGQERGVKALNFGLRIPGFGYNVFITGTGGTGRRSALDCCLLEAAKDKKIPPDICYTNNFKNPDMPRVLEFEPGQGKAFKKEMADFISALKRNIPQIFESDEYQTRRKVLTEQFGEIQKKKFKGFEKKITIDGFTLVQIQMGPYTRPDILPVIAGNPLNLDQLESLVEKNQFPREQFEAIQKRLLELMVELQQIIKGTRKEEKELIEKLKNLERDVVEPLVVEGIGEIRDKFQGQKVREYLDEVGENILANLSDFQEKPEGQTLPIPGQHEASFSEYEVNVLVDNSGTEGAPIVEETYPSYRNLFGSVERMMDRSGLWRTDFTKIKGGSLLRANGGYLIINAKDAFLEPGVWLALKRTLKTKRVEIQAYDPFFLFTTSSIKPEPIEVDLKVIMIGDHLSYHILYRYDEDFKKIFKAKADFDIVMDRNDASIKEYTSFITKICQEENLKPFDQTGAAGVLEYGARLAGKQKKLSTQFHQIADLVRESSYWAEEEGSAHVKEKHVDMAIENRIERLNLVESKIQEMIQDGQIMIDTEGRVVGQVNGLSVFDMGDYAFGRPSRITAKTSMGKAGVIDIEREVEMSGPIHTKGVYILSGYLRGMYAQDKPLNMSASLCFEQSYSGVEGDSASSTEVYALLSSLSEVPIRQDIAVTGSVNQKGEVQPIGGVNHKIEGFFDVCRARRLTGTQGVIIPHQNLEDLMLRKEVIEAVKKKKFHIYPIQTINQGIEILTCMKAGERRKDGSYEDGTLNHLVDQKLRELAENLEKFGETEEKDES